MAHAEPVAVDHAGRELQGILRRQTEPRGNVEPGVALVYISRIVKWSSSQMISRGIKTECIQ